MRNFHHQEQKRVDREGYFLSWLRFFFLFFSFSVVLCVCICCVGRRKIFPCRFGGAVLFYYIFCTHYFFTWYVVAGVCSACRIQQCMHVFFTSNRSCTRRNPAHVSILALARSTISSFSFICLFHSFPFILSLFHLSIYLGAGVCMLSLKYPVRWHWIA